jgi:hypothetical protein
VSKVLYLDTLDPGTPTESEPDIIPASLILLMREKGRKQKNIPILSYLKNGKLN